MRVECRPRHVLLRKNLYTIYIRSVHDNIIKRHDPTIHLVCVSACFRASSMRSKGNDFNDLFLLFQWRIVSSCISSYINCKSVLERTPAAIHRYHSTNKRAFEQSPEQPFKETKLTIRTHHEAFIVRPSQQMS